jgi:hypothetical protein
VGLGIMLKWKDWPIFFFSHALHGKNLDLSMYKKEMLALVRAIQKWHSYLLEAKFIVQTYTIRVCNFCWDKQLLWLLNKNYW